MEGKVEFYKETEFKDTEIGRIPKDWELKKLKDIVKIESGKRERGGGKGNGEVLSLGGENISPVGKLILNSPKYISKKFYNSLKSGRVKEKDILFVKDGATTGKVGFIDELPTKEVAVNEHLFIIRNKTNTVDQKFLYYIMISNVFQNQIKSVFHGIIGGITKSEMEEFYFPLPPLEEQQKIAEILSIIDGAIQKTDEIMDKTESLKKGLMQELFTKGIGHKEFKDTEIGRIPKEWEVMELNDATIGITDGAHWSPKSISRGEYRIATVANMKESYIDIFSCKLISEEDYLHLVKEGDVPEEGDVLFSKDGTVGICFTFNQKTDKIGVLSSIAIIKPNRNILLPDFTAYALKAPNIFRQVIGNKIGTGLKRIILDDLRKIKIVVPSLSEQQKIVEILLTLDYKIQILKQEENKLQKIKQWFMDHLLTGRIRMRIA